VAKLPDHLLAKQPRTLADQQAGERVPFPFYAFKIDAEFNLFATLVGGLDGSDSQFEYGEIWRDEDGTYHADPAWRSLQDLSV
jgi:hypothetical protein